MHKSVKARRITSAGHNAKDKILVMGMVERGGHVRTEIIKDRETATLRKNVRKHVERGTFLYTDELQAYKALHGDYDHFIIDHAERYVDGKVHTNGIENFWSLLNVKFHKLPNNTFGLLSWYDQATIAKRPKQERVKVTDSEEPSDEVASA
jgi:transposase-like protein